MHVLMTPGKRHREGKVEWQESCATCDLTLPNSMWNLAKKRIRSPFRSVKSTNEVPLQTEDRGKRLTEGSRAVRRVELMDQTARSSPVRRLVSDVLSIIFEMCSEDSWTAPLQIGLVCRQWREVVLATPRAWTFIQLHTPDGAKLAAIYFERSGEYLHHVHLNELSDFDQARLVSHRIQCLRVNPLHFDVTSMCWPNLTRLRLDITAISISDVTASNFPSLQHLAFPCVKSDQRDSEWSLPALQSLQFIATRDPTWAQLLHACRESLLSLRLGVPDEVQYLPPTKLYLPKLRALWLSSLFERTSWPVELTAPALDTYVQYQASYKMPNFLLHKDLSGVTCLCIHHVPTLSGFPRLRTFHLSVGPSNAHLEVMGQLDAGDEVCPRLETLKLNMPDMSSPELRAAQESMDNWSRHRRPALVTFITGLRPSQPLHLPEVTKTTVRRSSRERGTALTHCPIL